jgi:hypothetical protein
MVALCSTWHATDSFDMEHMTRQEVESWSWVAYWSEQERFQLI